MSDAMIQSLTALRKRKTTRRKLLADAGLAGAAVALGSGLAGTPGRGGAADAATLTTTYGTGKGKFAVTDNDILNFALNLEYLEAEYYNLGVNGVGLGDVDSTGIAGYGANAKAVATVVPPGTVTGGSTVPFATPVLQSYFSEIAADELLHVKFLRGALGGTHAVARPNIDFTDAFTNAAIAAGIISAGQTFNPFADEDSFLLGSFIFEDVGVTAYGGGSPYIKNANYILAAAGILAVEGYHASTVRSVLLQRGQSVPSLITAANQISALRNAASAGFNGVTPTDVPLSGATNSTTAGLAVVASNPTGGTYVRTFGSVLNIVYLNTTATPTPGGFFPSGMNGRIR